MSVPSPGLADQSEAVARIAEALLQELASVAGDQVGGSGRVAVMQDAGDGQRRAALGAPQRGVEAVEPAVSIVQGRANACAAGEQCERWADGLGSDMRLPGPQWRQLGGELDDRGGGPRAGRLHAMQDAR